MRAVRLPAIVAIEPSLLAAVQRPVQQAAHYRRASCLRRWFAGGRAAYGPSAAGHDGAGTGQRGEGVDYDHNPTQQRGASH